MSRKKTLAGVGVLVMFTGLLVMLTGVSNLNLSGPESSELGEASLVNAYFIDDDGEEIADLELETAYTDDEREQGLMFREELAEDRGMIFVYDDADERSFWMKNTFIPLDMIFVSSDRTVDSIRKADPQPNASDEELRSYRSDGPAQFVIESNQNFSENHGIEKGTEVVLEVAEE